MLDDSLVVDRREVSVWVPVSALASVRLLHEVANSFRLQSVRDGYRDWLDGQGSPLPPIVVRRRACASCPASCKCPPKYVIDWVDGQGRPVPKPAPRRVACASCRPAGHHVCGELKNGHHRLAIARELQVPLRVTYKIDDGLEAPFGWPASVNPAPLALSGENIGQLMHTLNRAEALALRDQMVNLFTRRQRATGEDLATAAQNMFASSNEETGELLSLSRTAELDWMSRVRHVTNGVRLASVDAATIARCTTALAVARRSLDDLIQTLEGKGASRAAVK